MELDKLYQNRFGHNNSKKNDIWIEIVSYLKRQIIKTRSVKSVVDIAAGYCEFINNFDLNGAKRYAFDLNPDVQRFADESVISINDSIDNLNKHFSRSSVSLFFVSNFLEHISKEQIDGLFADIYGILEPDGHLWVLTPNIKYVGGKYWDFWDHITPVTEESLIELAAMKGFKTKKVIKRFLPYTTKSSLPQSRWIVHLYLLLMPVSGLFFGEQSFLVFEKE